MLRYILLATLISIVIQAENLIRNPNFEGRDSWFQATWTPDRGSVQLENNTITISNEHEGQYTLIGQNNLALKSFSTYSISFRQKGEKICNKKNLQKNVNGSFIMILHKGKIIAKFSAKGPNQSMDGTFPWKRCQFTFKTGQISEPCAIYLVLHNASGTSSFSDLSLCPKSDENAQVTLIPVNWQNDTYNLAIGMPGTIHCQIQTTYHKGHNYSIILDLPKSIDLKAAAPWHIFNQQLMSDDFQKVESPLGLEHRRYIIKLSTKYASLLLPDKIIWRNYYCLYMMASKEEERGIARFQLMENQRPIAQPKTFTVTVLPLLQMPTEKLKYFNIAITYLYSQNAPSKELRIPGRNYWLALTHKPETSLGCAWEKLPQDEQNTLLNDFAIMPMLASAYTTPGCDTFLNWQKQHRIRVPNIQFSTGKQSPYICPGWLAEDALDKLKDYWDTVFQDRLQFKKIPKLKRIIWDFEPGANNYCFCTICRKQFSTHVNADHVLSQKEIQKNYGAVWFQFRVQQNAKIIRNFARYVKGQFPQLELALCTDNLRSKPPHISTWCGVDIRNIDNDFSLFMNMPYYQGVRWFDDLKFNQDNLKTPNYPLLDPSENIESFYKRYTPQGITMNMVAAAALGTQGIGFWPGDNFDACYLQAIANAAQTIATHEHFYCKGTLCTQQVSVTPVNVEKITLSQENQNMTMMFPDFTETIRFTAHRRGKNILITVFNYNTKENLLAHVKCSMPFPGTWHIYHQDAVYDQTNLSKGFLAEIPANTVQLFELSQELRPIRKTIRSLELERKLSIFQQQHRTPHYPQNQSSGGSQACWQLLPNTQTPVLRLATRTHAILVDPSHNAAIVGYQTHDKVDLLAQRNNQSVMDELHIFGYPNPLNFSVEKMEIQNGKPTITLVSCIQEEKSANPHSTIPSGLTIHKTIRLEEDGKTIHSNYVLTNTNTGRPLSLGFRIKHFPSLGSHWNIHQKSLTDLWTINFNGDQGKFNLKNLSSIHNLVLSKHVVIPPKELAGNIYPSRQTNETIELVAQNGEEHLSLTFSLKPFKDCAGTYVWWNPNSASTMEPFTQQFILKPGQRKTFDATIQYANKNKRK